jgi:hypothetical protein
MKRVFLVGRCSRKLRALWWLTGARAPIAGPFTLCGVVYASTRVDRGHRAS